MEQIYKKMLDSKELDHHECKFWDNNIFKYVKYLQNKEPQETKAPQTKNQLELSLFSKQLPLAEGIPKGNREYKIPPAIKSKTQKINPNSFKFTTNENKLSKKEYKKFERDLLSGREHAETLIELYSSGKINTKQYHNIKHKITPTTRGHYLTKYFGGEKELLDFEQKGIDYELLKSNSWLQKKYLEKKKRQINNSDLEKIIKKDWKTTAKGALIATALIATTCFGVTKLENLERDIKDNDELIKNIYATENIEQNNIVTDSLNSYIQNTESIRQRIAEINTQKEQNNLVSHKWEDTGNYCLINYFNANHPDVDVYTAIRTFEQDNPGVNPNILIDDLTYNFRTDYSNIEEFNTSEERENFVKHIDELHEEQFNTAYDVMIAQGYDPSITDDRKAFAEENLGGAINLVEQIEELQEPDLTINLENIISGNVYTVAITNENNEVLSCRNVLAHDHNQGTASLDYYDLNIPENQDYKLLLFDKVKLINSNNIERILETNDFEENNYLGQVIFSEGDELNLNVERRIDVGKINLGPEPWANILINGEGYGRTPIRGIELPPGTYDITFQRSEEDMDTYFSENRTYTLEVKAGEISSIRYNNGFNPEGTEYTIDNIVNTDSTSIESENKAEEEKEIYELPYDKIIENYNSNKRFKTVQKEFSDLEKSILVDTIKEGIENDSAYSKRFDKDYAEASGLIEDIKTMYENSISYKSIKKHCKRHGIGISDSTIYRIGKNTV